MKSKLEKGAMLRSPYTLDDGMSDKVAYIYQK